MLDPDDFPAILLDLAKENLFLCLAKKEEISTLFYEGEIEPTSGGGVGNPLLEIHSLLEKRGLSLQEVRSFVVSVGPGGFTALRISLSIFKTFSYVFSKPLYTFNSFDLLACHKMGGTTGFVITKGPGKSYFFAPFAHHKTTLSPAQITQEKLEEINRTKNHPLITRNQYREFGSSEMRRFFEGSPIQKWDTRQHPKISPLYVLKSQAEYCFNLDLS